MKNEQNSNQKISKLRSFIIRKPAVFAGALWGLSTFILFNFANILNAKNIKQFLLLLSVNGIIWTLGGIVYGKLLHRKIVTKEKKFDLELSEQDRLELFKWYKFGRLPISNHLQPMLHNYIEYLESNVRGNNFVTSKKEKNMGIALFGFFFIVMLFQIVYSLKLIYLLSALLLGFILILSIVSRPGKSNPLIERLNRHSINRIDRMKKQLK